MEPSQQPVNPQAAPTPQPATNPPVNTPTPAANTPTNLNDIKEIKEAGTTAIVLGILMVLLGAALGYFYSPTALINIPLGIIYLVYGLKLRNKQASLSQVITTLRILLIAAIINILLALLGGRGAGLLTLILLFFVVKASKELFKAGLTTSSSAFNAKAK